METMEAKYDEQAREAGVYIVSSCAFDCIPNDLGALLLQRTFSGELAYVESYVNISDEVRRIVRLSLCRDIKIILIGYHTVLTLELPKVADYDVSKRNVGW